MNEAQAKQLADLTTAVAGLTKTVENIQARLTAAPAATADPGAAATTGAATADAKPEAKIVVLETKIATLEEAQKLRAKADADRIVAEAVKEGRIPAQNKELIDKWTNLILVDAKNAELLPSPNPALTRVTAPNGAAVSAAGNAEHAFVVKARAYAQERKIENITDAQAEFAGTVEGRELYDAYRKEVRVNQKSA